MFLFCLFACTTTDKDTAPAAFQFPSPTDMPTLRGPGAPQQTFAEEELFVNCAPLYGGENDFLHHNLVVGYRGHMVMPWAPEWGRGGLSLFDMSNPCEPEKIGEGYHERMRESHAIGFQYLSETEQYAVATGILGIQFWDMSSLDTPEMINYMQIDEIYPDSYTRVVLSVFWQYPHVYVAAADNGFFIVDASDPYNPTLVNQYEFDPPLRAASIYALGINFLGAAEGSEFQSMTFQIRKILTIPGGRSLPDMVKTSGILSMVENWLCSSKKVVVILMMNISTQATVRLSTHKGNNGEYVITPEI